MPFQKGHKRIGGREKGVLPAKARLALQARETLEKMGHDPLRRMAQIAEDLNNPIEVRSRMETELCKYVYPQLKSIEHTGIPESEVQIEINVRHLESLRARAASLTQRERERGVLPIAIPERTGTD
jgi:hypothetical protein